MHRCSIFSSFVRLHFSRASCNKTWRTANNAWHGHVRKNGFLRFPRKKHSCQLFAERERSPIAEWNFDVASPYLLKRNQIHIAALHFNQAPVVPIGRGITSSDYVAWINLCLSKFRSLFNMDQFWFSEVPDFIVKLSITGPWRSITGRKISIKPCNYRFQLRQSSN